MAFDPNTAQLVEQPKQSNFDPSTAKLVSDSNETMPSWIPKSKQSSMKEFFTEKLPESAGKAIEGLKQGVIHPIKTAKTLGQVAIGEIEKLSPVWNVLKSAGIVQGESSDEKIATAVNKVYGGRISHPLKTAYEDPVGFAMDLSTLLSGVGGALGKVGEVGEIGKLSEAGNILSKAGEVIDPLTQAGKAVGKGIIAISKGTGRLLGEGLGITTGAGYGAIKQAFEHPTPAYTKALRGETTGEDVVNSARESLGAIKQSRHEEYVSKLNTLKKSSQQLDISPIIREVRDQLNKFNIVKKADGTLDFSRSVIRFDKSAQDTINTIYNEMKTFGTKAGDRTVIGVDNLKRSFQDLYSPSSNVRAFTSAVSNGTRKVLSKVEGYDKMASDYASKTEQIDSIMKGLSLGETKSIDTAIRKLTSVFRQNNEFRKDLLSQLEEVGGKDLSGMVAGYQLNPIAPRGLFGRLEEIGGGVKIFSNPAILLNPKFLAAMVGASPRAVGELLRGIGLTKIQSINFLNYIAKTPVGKILTPKIPAILRVGYYGGRNDLANQK
jgi:PIN domain nuclease of toxin-antitoxin system